jgi:NADH-quinone oxidoreductase subunit G
VTDWLDLDSFLQELVREIPVFARIAGAAAPASFRVGGLKIPRQSHRYSGRTAMRANIAVSETGVAQDLDSPLSFSMEGFSRMAPAALLSSFWTPGWNSAQSITRFQEEVNGPLEGGDPGIRLIDPDPDSRIPYFRVPESEPKTARFTAVGRQHIFGSEELSAISPPIAQLTPAPYVLVHPLDATALGLAVGDTAEVSVNGGAPIALRVSFGPAIARGVIALPEGLAGVPFFASSAPAELRKGGGR